MTATPLAEAYEKLKELRRQGDSRSDDVRSILRAVQAKVSERAIFISHGESDAELAEKLVRLIEIQTLAERVFGDQVKANAWLKRPNRNLSGQQPLDLLKDELGAAVVRETLERIDHGIFA
jgi:putative toxin-antitoxin system antitoxin component (TIGR02293 family)